MVRARFDAKPLAEVRAMMRSAFPCPDRIVTLPVAGAAGRVTAGPVYSSLTIPATEIAARDGFAVVSGETSGRVTRAPSAQEPQRVTRECDPSGYDGRHDEDVNRKDGAWYTKNRCFPENIYIRRLRISGAHAPLGAPGTPCDIGALLFLSAGNLTWVGRPGGEGRPHPDGSELFGRQPPGAGRGCREHTAVCRGTARRGPAPLHPSTGAAATKPLLLRSRAHHGTGIREKRSSPESPPVIGRRRDFPPRRSRDSAMSCPRHRDERVHRARSSAG